MFDRFENIELFMENRQNLGIKPGLHRIRHLLEMLGNPQNDPIAIHVAGTNGKGSTICYLQQALQANGYRVGVFSSPSMSGLLGYIFCNNNKITKNQFISLFREVYPYVRILDEAGEAPTEFEIMTAIAFLYFSRFTDITLIEVGMGGREDTTNVCHPILSIITNVALDHTAFLGDTLEEIACHKAGIIKNNIPVIVGKMNQKALAIIKHIACRKSAPTYTLLNDFFYERLEQSPYHQIYQFQYAGWGPFRVCIRMKGTHQVANSALAVMALIQMTEQGFSIDWQKALNGIYRAHIPGRFEVVHSDPLIVLDGAHNPAGIQSFLDTIQSMNHRNKKHLIFAGFKDKDVQTMLTQLTPYFLSITLTSFNHPRAAKAKELYKLTKRRQKYLWHNWKKAVDILVDRSKISHHALFITGSLHFIALVRHYLQTKLSR